MPNSVQMDTMATLTKKQEGIRKFIETELKAGRACPTHREIASHFKFASHHGAARHVAALVKKGVLVVEQGKSRALRLAENFKALQLPAIVEIPLYGSIPAGFADEREQEPDSFVSVDAAEMGFKPSRNIFALRVKGDSMIGRHICDGDVVVLEHGRDPRNGEIVAALIDRKTTLKTFVQKGGRKYLKAENPKYPDLIPSEELVIHGIFKGLIRKA